MNDHILTLNAGSSSLKLALFAAGDDLEQRCRGNLDGLGAEPGFAVHGPDGESLEHRAWPDGAGPANQGEALQSVLEFLNARFPSIRIAAVGHRVVHGGPDLCDPVVLDATMVERLTRLNPLAPLHQPHNLAGVAAARDAFPDAVQIACFDTAFHRSHPWVNDTFALPRRYYEAGVRRYGFHGLSYEYVVSHLQSVAPTIAAGRVIVAHLGNGASMCAIRDGMSVGSTMGFTALDGLPMGTRTGQIDPGVLLYLMSEENMSVDDVTDLLYRESGLKGLSGLSHDMRTLEAAGTPEAEQAIAYFVFRIRRELGAMAAVLGGVDAIVFTGGIGENSPRVRGAVASGLEWLGVELDEFRNRSGEAIISSDRSRVRTFVVPTNEEAMIARHCRRLMQTPHGAAAAAS